MGDIFETMSDGLDAAERERARGYYAVRKTIMQLLHDRGYVITQAELNMTFEDFTYKFPLKDMSDRKGLEISRGKTNDPLDKILVTFPDDAKVGVSDFKRYLETMKKNEIQRAIVVVQQDITPYSQKALEYLRTVQTKFVIETFSESQLLVNITSHQLVPKHEVLTPAEKQALLEKYKLRETQLPRMTAKDPVAKYFGLLPGEVVKITRPSETAGRYVTYRLVY